MMVNSEASQVIVFIFVIIFLRLFLGIHSCFRRPRAECSSNPQGSTLRTVSVDRVLNEIDKPVQFSAQQLRIATDNFSHFLGEGGFGAVYKGILSIGSLVAVKVLNGSSDKKIEDQFLAEVGTIGRTHHINLVKLYGFCFDKDLQAIVYEYVENSSLDRILFQRDKHIDWDLLHNIAIGTAKGIEYLHEDCHQRIIHYDIKPENILLDVNFCPKIADFGLAKLCNREKTHITLTGGRGTPGYAAPEMWMPFPITHKCDVYSFGMLLFEILGRRRNMDVNLSESQEWFPKWVWKKLEKGELPDLMVVCGIEEKDKVNAERMALVALWCVQYKQEARPCMSVVVKMLEGGVEIPTPKNPFRHLMKGYPHPDMVAKMTIEAHSSSQKQLALTESSAPLTTTIMSKCEIELGT